MKALYANVPEASSEAESRAEWDTAYINDLPDSAFAYIEGGGSKDEGGKTTPRSLRHFPHHDASGAPDAAHVRNALARIPQSGVGASAKASATAHVRKHASALNIGQDSLPEFETRAFADFELRESKEEAGRPPQMVGHAAVFGQLSEDLGGFRERIGREAFRKTLQEADVRALINHDSNLVLGRTSNGTLRLREDRIGLLAEMDLPNTSYARDLAELVRRGDISQMSFAFRVIRDDWEQIENQNVRTLKEVSLNDVSVVTNPAYPQTDLAMRSLQSFLSSLEGAAARTGAASGATDLAAVDAVAEMIRRRKWLEDHRFI